MLAVAKRDHIVVIYLGRLRGISSVSKHLLSLHRFVPISNLTITVQGDWRGHSYYTVCVVSYPTKGRTSC